jgi:dUTP pyrophosphatase
MGAREVAKRRRIRTGLRMGAAAYADRPALNRTEQAPEEPHQAAVGDVSIQALAVLIARAMSEVRVLVARVAGRKGEPLPLPAYETAGSSGMDLRADLEAAMELPPLGRAVVPTGMAIAVPEGFEAQVRPRSGLAARHGITCLNTPGTIDSDYRGEIGVVLVNLSGEPYRIERGDRIAQLVVAPVARATLVETDFLSETRRGSGGFGHTGSK